MTNQSTLDLLVSLGLHGMAKGFKELEAQSRASSLDHAQWLALLLEQEQKLRQQKRFENRARAARLRLAANYEDIEDLAPRGLDSAQFLELAACDWIRARQNLLVIGPSGVGKSWLACALGYRALIKDFTVAYHRVPRLFAALAVARADGRYNRMLRAIARLDLLILDDWGPDQARCRAAPRSPGNHRGPLRIAIDDRHQPTARRRLVRDHRQPDHRSGGARSPRP
jgi:DNA replication protein DnaC